MAPRTPRRSLRPSWTGGAPRSRGAPAARLVIEDSARAPLAVCAQFRGPADPDFVARACARRDIDPVGMAIPDASVPRASVCPLPGHASAVLGLRCARCRPPQFRRWYVERPGL